MAALAFNVSKIGLDEDDLGTAVDEAADLLGIGDLEVVEGDGPIARVVDVWRERGGAVGRPEGAGHEPAAPVLHPGGPRRLTGQAGTLPVEVVDGALHPVIGLGHGGRREGVGLDDVGPGPRIGEVDGPDGVGLAQRQQVVVALEVTLAAERMPAVVELLFAKAQSLDLRPHRAVEHQDPV